MMFLENEKSPPAIAFSVVLSVVSVVGLIGNAIVMFMLLLTRDYRKTNTNWYILQLTLADIMFLATIPLRVSESIRGYWTESLAACKANQSILFINYSASVLFLTVMSVDRYVAVCCQFSSKWQKLLRGPKASIILAILVWIWSILSAYPIFVNSDIIGVNRCNCVLLSSAIKENNPCEEFSSKYSNFNHTCPTQSCISEKEHKSFCMAAKEFQNQHRTNRKYSLIAEQNSSYFQPKNDIPVNLIFVFHACEKLRDTFGKNCLYTSQQTGVIAQAFIWYNFTMFFLLPILIMSVCYGLIIKNLRRKLMQDHRFNPKASGKVRTQADRKRRLTILCVTLVMLFIMCRLLYHFLEIGKLKSSLGLSEYNCKILSEISMVLIYTNSALNPYLYSFLGTGLKHKWQLLKSSYFVKQVVEITTKLPRTSGQCRNVNKPDSQPKKAQVARTNFDNKQHTFSVKKAFSDSIENKVLEEVNSEQGRWK